MSTTATSPTSFVFDELATIIRNACPDIGGTENPTRPIVPYSERSRFHYRRLLAEGKLDTPFAFLDLGPMTPSNFSGAYAYAYRYTPTITIVEKRTPESPMGLITLDQRLFDIHQSFVATTVFTVTGDALRMQTGDQCPLNAMFAAKKEELIAGSIVVEFSAGFTYCNG